MGKDNCQALSQIFGIAAAVGMATLAGTAQAASGGVGKVPEARQVFMKDVPNFSATGPTAPRVIHRPLTAMPESTYQALKEQAASPHGVPLPVTLNGPPQPRPVQGTGRETPAASCQFRRR